VSHRARQIQTIYHTWQQDLSNHRNLRNIFVIFSFALATPSRRPALL
jgi:hypothetical protein